MGRIVDARGTEALAVAADLIGILTEIAGDGAFLEGLKNGMTAGETAAVLLQRHGEAVIRLLALDDGVDEAEEAGRLTPFAVPGRLIALLRDPAVRVLFGSAAAENGGNGSSAA